MALPFGRRGGAAKSATVLVCSSLFLYGLRQWNLQRRRREKEAASQAAGDRPQGSRAPPVPGKDDKRDLSALFAFMPPPGTRVGVNAEFLRQLKAVLRICIPDAQSKEVLIIALHTIFLLLRTYLSVVVAKIDGRIVRDLVAANGKEFLKGLGYWFAIALPATYTNSMIRYLQSKLAIGFRTRLMSYINGLYLDKEMGYYRLLTLDNRIDSPDQYIVTDVAKFCDTLSALYSNLGKPIIDIVIFNYQLARYIGMTGMCGLAINYFVTARILRAVTPSFGRMAAVEAKLEGDFRTAHTRLTLNAEEICFYNGENREKSLLEAAYLKLVKHVNSIYRTRIPYNMFEDFLIKYVWSAVGLGVCAVPVFLPQYSGSRAREPSEEESVAVAAQGIAVGSSNLPEAPRGNGPAPRKARNHTQAFITNKRLLLSLADAGGRVMYSYKNLAELAGYTSRVYSLLSVLHAVHDHRYVAGDSPDTQYSLTGIHGHTKFGKAGDTEGLKFSEVDVVVPNPTGANGVGKTSVARVVRGLWPLFEGKMHRPRLGDIFYIPQRPYLVLGSLRDQLIYPDSVEDMRRKGKTDEDLNHILDLVHLAYLPDREGGFDTVKEWKDVLSGGEKQRANLARMFYHAPKYAFLDECTSAVSPDVEGLMYNRAKEMGITLITISHRPSLFKYHNVLLRFTDDGRWEVTQIGTAAESMSLEKEAAMIEERIRDLPKHKKRLEEVNEELGLAQQ